MVLLLLLKFDSGRDLLYNLLKQNVMAKSENVIRGRIGNMIFYRVRGVTRIRSVPLSAVRPDALKCRTARLRLIAAVRFYQRLQDTRLRDIWRLAAKDTAMNGYNLFVKQNIHVFNERTLFDPARLLLVSGTLPPMNCLELAEQTGRRIVLTWKNSLEPAGVRATDRVGVVALCEGKMYSPLWLDKAVSYRQEQRVAVELEGLPAGTVHLYCFFVSADGTAYSPGSYLCIHLKSDV